MHIEHLPTASFTAALLLRLARTVGRRVRALIRTALLAGGALVLASGTGQLATLSPPPSRSDNALTMKGNLT